MERLVMDVFDVFELNVGGALSPDRNPFTVDVSLRATVDGEPSRTYPGFWDGEKFRVRVMPQRAGIHAYVVVIEGEEVASGEFEAVAAGRSGVLRVDAEFPWHFRREGDEVPTFLNGTTAYAMVGLDEEPMADALDRLASAGINRLRVALFGPRVKGGEDWFEPTVTEREDFTFLSAPWEAAQPESVEDPQFDVYRFNLLHWERFEFLVREAAARGIELSVIFFVDGQKPGNYPFADESTRDAERLYYRYAIARLGAFPNVHWCLTNEYHLFRPEEWVHSIGRFVRETDTHGHLISVHGHPEYPFRDADWSDFASFQSWDESGAYAFMRGHRDRQQAADGPKPQINEEYGYEDHYPQGWGEARSWPARTPDNRRRLAWQICMAGGYATTGESAQSGLGGWINGYGDGMNLLMGHAFLVEFFTEIEWYALDPVDDVANGYGLAMPGLRYALYLPDGGSLTASIVEGEYDVRGFDPRAGVWHDLGTFDGSLWTSPPAERGTDLAFVLDRAYPDQEIDSERFLEDGDAPA